MTSSFSPPPPLPSLPPQGASKQKSSLVLILVIVGCAVVFGGLVVAVLAGIGFQAFSKASETSRLTQATLGLKNTHDALLMYSQDNDDRYPFKDEAGREFTTSNEAFRELFKGGIAIDERMFEVKGGPAAPDGQTGGEPDYARALDPGECHWAMAKGASATDPAGLPLVWENSASGGWNPTWNPKADRRAPGSTWSNGRILVLQQSGAVRTHKLANKSAPSHLEGLGGGSSNIFSQGEAKEVLDPVGLR